MRWCVRDLEAGRIDCSDMSTVHVGVMSESGCCYSVKYMACPLHVIWSPSSAPSPVSCPPWLAFRIQSASFQESLTLLMVLASALQLPRSKHWNLAMACMARPRNTRGASVPNRRVPLLITTLHGCQAPTSLLLGQCSTGRITLSFSQEH